ncbi:MoaD/ThiS family protein [Polaromonas jejuensis]|uniref:MoaD/ThiS family protein n=1 Tax=Polaromonas jejuensis TaxID=457502 RepID=A0ABW0QCC9_9BURK|nr:MoaD/ThiS family protein [Polaromonas jejuensis]
MAYPTRARNGHDIQPEQRLTRTLLENDVLEIWPPIAAG